MSDRPFHIITIVNDAEQYAAMRQSFETAGFDDAVARYTSYDNSRSNVAEPYGILRTVDVDGDEPYTILCHQDVRLDLGATATDLLSRLDELDRTRPEWAIAGNAGVTGRARGVYHLNDPGGTRRASGLPINVRSLDENFLVIRRNAGPLSSDGLSGFHLYGTDACLCATAKCRGAYVIDFLLTHLSAGNADVPAFHNAASELMCVWRPRVLVGIVRTTCTDLVFARWAWADRLIKLKWPRRLLRRSGMSLIFVPGRRRY